MNKQKLSLDFSNGQFAEHVTGALVYIPEFKIILDCGLSQSNSIKRDRTENNAKFNFSCKNVQAIFISHGHLDHTGRLPLLYKRGCSAPIYIAKGNYNIIKNMLEDSVKILAKEALLLSKQMQKDLEPLYTIEDVNNTLAHIKEYDFNEIYDAGEFKFEFVPAGHIKYSAQVVLYLPWNNVIKKIVYTGDLGNYKLPKQFTEEFIPIDKCDTLIAETTYGDKSRPKATSKMRKKDLEKLKVVIKQYCVDSDFRILIPCFALDRTPEMYMILRQIIQENSWDVPILIDSPLSIKQLKVYAQDEEELEKALHDTRTWLCSEYQESMVFQQMTGPMIILSSSGMLNAGRVLSYLPRILSNPHNCIVFCGYASEGTLAWEIKNSHKKYIEFMDKKIPNNANIVTLNSFSSHMQYNELLDYYSTINCEKIYLVHGQLNVKTQFANELKEALEKKNKTTQVICVNKGTEGKV